MKIPPEIHEKIKKYPSFYRDVWRVCAEIPKGETRTYLWIARKIGRPRAARAVGSALGKNPFFPVIPCHRVIRSDGTIGGYSGRGGTKSKARLLKMEQKTLSIEDRVFLCTGRRDL